MFGENRELQVWWERIDAVLRGNVWIGDGKDTVEIDFTKATLAEPDRLLEFATMLAARAKSLRVKVRFEHLILLALCDVPCWRGIPVQAMFHMMRKNDDQARDLKSFLKGGIMGPKKFIKELYMRGFACDNRSLVIPCECWRPKEAFAANENANRGPGSLSVLQAWKHLWRKSRSLHAPVGEARAPGETSTLA